MFWRGKEYLLEDILSRCRNSGSFTIFRNEVCLIEEYECLSCLLKALQQSKSHKLLRLNPNTLNNWIMIINRVYS